MGLKTQLGECVYRKVPDQNQQSVNDPASLKNPRKMLIFMSVFSRSMLGDPRADKCHVISCLGVHDKAGRLGENSLSVPVTIPPRRQHVCVYLKLYVPDIGGSFSK